MYCKYNRATISIRTCILRQDFVNKQIQKEKIKIGDTDEEETEGSKKLQMSTFRKCIHCTLGLKIKTNPNPELDRDIKKLIKLVSYLKSEKRPKYELKCNGLVCFAKYKLKEK